MPRITIARTSRYDDVFDRISLLLVSTRLAGFTPVSEVTGVPAFDLSCGWQPVMVISIDAEVGEDIGATIYATCLRVDGRRSYVCVSDLAMYAAHPDHLECWQERIFGEQPDGAINPSSPKHGV